MTATELKKNYLKQYQEQRANNFKYLRVTVAKENNLTRFSELVGIPATRISELEHGHREPSQYHILTYRDYFFRQYNIIVSTDYLYGFTDIIENKNAIFADDIGLSEESINTLKKVKENWDIKENNTLNYVMKDSDAFIDFLKWLSIYIDNEYTIPIYYDSKTREYIDCGYHTSNGDGITFGKQITDNKGNDGYKIIGVGVDIIESHAMIQMQEIIKTWRDSKGSD